MKSVLEASIDSRVNRCVRESQKGKDGMGKRKRRNTMYTQLQWYGTVTGGVVSEIMLFARLITGPVAGRIYLILGICWCTAVIVFLIFRRPWK